MMSSRFPGNAVPAASTNYLREDYADGMAPVYDAVTGRNPFRSILPQSLFPRRNFQRPRSRQ